MAARWVQVAVGDEAGADAHALGRAQQVRQVAGQQRLAAGEVDVAHAQLFQAADDAGRLLHRQQAGLLPRRSFPDVAEAALGVADGGHVVAAGNRSHGPLLLSR